MSAETKRDPWLVCPVCEGERTTVNPAIDAHGLTREDFDEDPDFAEDYRSGVFNIPCRACSGRGTVKASRIAQLERNAEDRRLAAREDGDHEAFSTAHDHRWG